MGITFSFIIPTYNSKKTIIRAIESVTKQLDKSEYEIIIVDDGSQDGTVELVHDFMKDNGNIHLLVQLVAYLSQEIRELIKRKVSIFYF